LPPGIAANAGLSAGETPEAKAEDAMKTAMEGVRTLQVTYAARQSEFDGHAMKEGDFLALDDGCTFRQRQRYLADTQQHGGIRGWRRIHRLYSTAATFLGGCEKAKEIFEQNCPDADSQLAFRGPACFTIT
jgi:hypothetical protein